MLKLIVIVKIEIILIEGMFQIVIMEAIMSIIRGDLHKIFIVSKKFDRE